MLENAYYSVITPEGCAAILLRDAGKARQSAALLKLTPADLLGFNVIDRIIREPGEGAHRDPDGTAAAIKAALIETLQVLVAKPLEELLAQRHDRYLGLGSFSEAEIEREHRSLLQRLRGLF
jgi:acetyl-CoA carboxylase carboxyl transferase subunit alpha